VRLKLAEGRGIDPDRMGAAVARRLWRAEEVSRGHISPGLWDEGPNGMRRSVGRSNGRHYTGALRGGFALKGWQMVCCVAQAESPAGPHTGQNNLPNRRGT
jgi:hypothetical protein